MANPLICVFNPVTSLIDEVQSASLGPAAVAVPIVTNVNGVIDSSLLGIGSTATAGQAFSSGTLLNLYSSGGTLHAQIASAQNGGGSPPAGPYPLQAQGFAATSVGSGSPVTVSFFGTFKYIDGNSEFFASNIGQEVFLSNRGDGSPTLTPPSGVGELEQSVGYVVAFASPNVVTINFASGFQDFTHISGVNPITKGGTGAITGAQALINLIGGSPTTGQALVWSGSAWVPGTDLAGFNQITTGTNITATMTVGTGASIVVSGTGVVEATELATTGAAVVVSTAAPPSAGQVLTATSATAADWQTLTAPAGGSPTQLQFNNAGVLDGASNSSVSVAGAVVLGNVNDPSPVLTTALTVAGSGGIAVSIQDWFSSNESNQVVASLKTSGLINVQGVNIGNTFSIGAIPPLVVRGNSAVQDITQFITGGTSTPANVKTVWIDHNGNLNLGFGTISGGIFDSANSLGTSGQSLTSTGTQTLWAAPTISGFAPSITTKTTSGYTAVKTDFTINADSTTPITLTLTDAQAHVGGTTTYDGTITGGAGNAFAGYWFTIDGFGLSANNGSFLCTASTATTLDLNNGAGTAEVNAATAAYFLVHLPTTLIATGQIFRVKSVSFSGPPTNAVTVISTANIDFISAPGDQKSVGLVAALQSVEVQWDGTQYWIY